jgi:hypothetical protein
MVRNHQWLRKDHGGCTPLPILALAVDTQFPEEFPKN